MKNEKRNLKTRLKVDLAQNQILEHENHRRIFPGQKAYGKSNRKVTFGF
jgi:hypothetical protein